jgi:AMP-polyphosphate phosphotransferase
MVPAFPAARTGPVLPLAQLRAELIRLQVRLKEADRPLILIIAGVDGAGKGQVVNALNAWLDPRRVETHAFDVPSDEERERPPFYRYWRCLPERGRMAIFFNSWYTEALLQEAYGAASEASLDRTLARITSFERMLVADGALIVKCWLHLSKTAQARRLRDLENDPNTRWRVSPGDWQHHLIYDRIVRLAKRMFRATDAPGARWDLIDARDEKQRDRAVAETLLRRFDGHLENPPAPRALLPRGGRPAEGLLAAVPVRRKLSKEVYGVKKARLLTRLNHLIWEAERKGRSVIFVFEGWDAAGKGGAIRRLVSAIDARFYRVIPVSAPSDEEKRRHYLWRFWRHLPRAGRMVFFDRSWYGRVLVERVEQFASPPDWKRAYREINEFEEQLTSHGILLLKFWLHITPEEQLRRFKRRARTPYKRHKLGQEDWRNRAQWPAYERAVEEMVARTDRATAPWHLIAADDKRYARIEILRLTCRSLEAALRADRKSGAARRKKQGATGDEQPSVRPKDSSSPAAGRVIPPAARK